MKRNGDSRKLGPTQRLSVAHSFFFSAPKYLFRNVVLFYPSPLHFPVVFVDFFNSPWLQSAWSTRTTRQLSTLVCGWLKRNHNIITIWIVHFSTYFNVDSKTIRPLLLNTGPTNSHRSRTSKSKYRVVWRVPLYKIFTMFCTANVKLQKALKIYGF